MAWRFNGYCEDFKIDPRRARQYLGLFCFLAVVYPIALATYIKFIAAAPVINGLGDLMRPLVKFCLVSALPFAVVACLDQNWHSSDAAPVCVAAWAAACAACTMIYGTRCPYAFLYPFVPLIFSALLAHTFAHAVGNFGPPAPAFRQHNS